MESTKGFIYKGVMKDARKLYRNLGISLFLYLIIFGAVRDYVLIPLMGKLWGLVLLTTPEGFISNANFLEALLKSPWIIPVGVLLALVYAFLAMWQVSAILLGIGYVREGKNIRVRDLLKLSFLRIWESFRGKNWMMLVYAMLIVPMSNVYQTNDLVSKFVVPEYIQDFINANVVLFLIFLLFILFVCIVALKWFFLLPSFILKKKDFKEARDESVALTKKGLFKNGINMTLYGLVELIRISIVPICLILLPVFLCYLLTSRMEFSASLFRTLGISIGMETAANITGTLVQVSTMCFLEELYFVRLEEEEMETEVFLPPLRTETGWKMSIVKLQTIVSALSSLLIAFCYLVTVLAAQLNGDVIYEIFGKTEIIAHKGYSSKAPENTMPAFSLADSCREVTVMELDVWSSSDGIPVVVHNESIKDATGVDKCVYECTAEELSSLPAPYAMNAEEFQDARIPTLEEVIKTYAASTPLLIEIKGYGQDPALPAKIVELMKKYGCEQTSMIHSGNYGALKAVKAVDPTIRCGLILAIVTGNYYDLPCADFFSIEHNFITSNTVSQLHRRGKEVYAWTVNYADSAESLKFSGVDGLITDYPEEMNSYVSDTNDLLENVFKRDLNRLLEESTSYDKGDY